MALFLGYNLFLIPEGLNVCSILNTNDFHDPGGVEDVDVGENAGFLQTCHRAAMDYSTFGDCNLLL